MALFFPAQKDTGKANQQFLKLKEHTALILAQLQGQNIEADKIKNAEGYLLGTTKPQQFWGPDGVEAKAVVRFEDVCINMQQHVTKDPKTMTVLEFFRTLENIKKKVKQAEKKTRSANR